MGLLMGSLFCSTDLVSIALLTLFFFLNIARMHGSLYLHMKFRNISISEKNDFKLSWNRIDYREGIMS